MTAVFVWVLVQDDELELPVAVADSMATICQRMGLNSSTIKSRVSRGLPVCCCPWSTQKVRCRAVKVRIDDEE